MGNLTNQQPSSQQSQFKDRLSQSTIKQNGSVYINGTSQSQNQNQKTFLSSDQDLTFYIDVDDPILGYIPIYTSKKMPLCFIMKISSQIIDSKIYNLFQRIQNSQVPALISLYGYQMKRHKYCDKILKQTVVSYWQYYNFYFFDYLKKRTVKGCPIMESQIWHIVQICCQGSAIFKKYNCYYDFSPKTMVVTPQGKLKLVWWHLLSQNKHLRYFKFFQNYQKEQFFYSPQELQLIQNRQLTTKLNFDKCNSFAFGMLLLQSICLINPINVCYSQNFSKVNFKMIKNLIQEKIASNYSEQVVIMLTGLLQKQPKSRTSLQKVYERYKHNMSDENQLRVCGGKKDANNNSSYHNKFAHHKQKDKDKEKPMFKFENLHKKKNNEQKMMRQHHDGQNLNLKEDIKIQSPSLLKTQNLSHMSLNNNINGGMMIMNDRQNSNYSNPHINQNMNYYINTPNTSNQINSRPQTQYFSQNHYTVGRGANDYSNLNSNLNQNVFQQGNPIIGMQNNNLHMNFKPNSPDFSDAKTVKNYGSSRKNIGNFKLNQ